MCAQEIRSEKVPDNGFYTISSDNFGLIWLFGMLGCDAIKCIINNCDKLAYNYYFFLKAFFAIFSDIGWIQMLKL